MNETDKAVQRRLRDPLYAQRYLVGQGIDIGCGSTPLSLYCGQLSRMEAVRGWDLPDGDAQFMAGVPDGSYDFVHSSHCLEHLEDPRVALRHWLRILKPGGFLVVTVPDEELYEHGCWPSRFNADHKWSFTLYRAKPLLPRSLNVLDLLREFSDEVECERIVQLREHYDEHVSDHVDQTLGAAECAIEWVWRKRVAAPVRVKSAQDWLHEGLIAEHRQADDQAAEIALREACACTPALFDAYNCLAHLLSRLGRYDEVEALWREAVQRMPGAQTRIHLALYLLQRGKYREGFRIREACVPDARRTPTLPDVAYPRWQGEPLKGKSIVIWTEFGLGDEIMFSRFAQDLKHRLGAARVSVLCQDSLYSVLNEGLIGADLVLPVSQRDALPQHDYWVFPHSIPPYRELSVDNIPAPVPYIHVSTAESAKWAVRMDLPSRKLKVGVVWQGNPTHENDAYRSFGALGELSELLSIEGVTFVSLQKGRGEEEAKQWAQDYPAWRALGHEFANMGDTAAVIANLDLVIAVDTSVAHLAAAMGRPVWLLLPTVCDWRWMLAREDSPWYPSVRIFRQQRLGQWAAVLARVKEQLIQISSVRHIDEKPLVTAEQPRDASFDDERDSLSTQEGQL